MLKQMNLVQVVSCKNFQLMLACFWTCIISIFKVLMIMCSVRIYSLISVLMIDHRPRSRRRNKKKRNENKKKKGRN